jgi:hypothetical protein
VHQLTWTEQKAAGNSEGHSSVHSCGFSNWIASRQPTGAYNLESAYRFLRILRTLCLDSLGEHVPSQNVFEELIFLKHAYLSAFYGNLVLITQQ